MKSRKRTLFLVLIPAALTQLACLMLMGIECEATGGTWQRLESSDGQVAFWCTDSATLELNPSNNDNGPVPEETAALPAADAGQAGECLAPQGVYTWAYEDFRQDSGSGGVVCSARFVLKNLSNDPLSLKIYTAWDNQAMQFTGWKSYSLQPGTTWEQNVSRTNYTDGAVTFLKVEHILVSYDTPACAALFSEENQSSWETQSIPIEEIACP
jgi:hypothetical protein